MSINKKITITSLCLGFAIICSVEAREYYYDNDSGYSGMKNYRYKNPQYRNKKVEEEINFPASNKTGFDRGFKSSDSNAPVDILKNSIYEDVDKYRDKNIESRYSDENEIYDPRDNDKSSRRYLPTRNEYKNDEDWRFKQDEIDSQKRDLKSRYSYEKRPSRYENNYKDDYNRDTKNVRDRSYDDEDSRVNYNKRNDSSYERNDDYRYDRGSKDIRDRSYGDKDIQKDYKPRSRYGNPRYNSQYDDKDEKYSNEPVKKARPSSIRTSSYVSNPASKFTPDIAQDILSEMLKEEKSSKPIEKDEALKKACKINSSSGSLKHLACSYIFQNIYTDLSIYKDNRDQDGRLQFGSTYSNDYKTCTDMMETNYKYICKDLAKD